MCISVSRQETIRFVGDCAVSPSYLYSPNQELRETGKRKKRGGWIREGKDIGKERDVGFHCLPGPTHLVLSKSRKKRVEFGSHTIVMCLSVFFQERTSCKVPKKVTVVPGRPKLLSSE